MTTPFSSVPASYRGARPSYTPSTELRSRRLWVGDPTSSVGMVEWPGPASGYTATRSRSRVVHGLYGGGTAVTYFDGAARSWPLSWTTLTERDWQLIVAFDTPGIMGTPPWCMLDVEGVNRLTAVQSLCGLRHGTVEGWTPTAGTVATSTAATAAVTPCGVMQWTPAASGDRLLAGSLSGSTPIPTVNYAAPNVPAEYVTFQIMARAVSGSASAHVRIAGMNTDGSGPVYVNSTAATLGTTWQALTVTAGPGAFGSLPWLVPSVVADGASAVLLTNPSLSYTSQAPDWVLGAGVPRVLITSDLPRSLSKALWTGLTVTLTEAVTGAA